VLAQASGNGPERLRPPDSCPPLPGRECLRITLAGDERLHHRSARDAVDVGCHAGELDERVFEQLLDALFLPDAVMGQVDAESGVVAELADLDGRMNDGRNMPRLFSLARHTASNLSVFGRLAPA